MENLNEVTSTTQNKEILEWLKKGNTISALDALTRFNCFRLSARIYDLKKLGYNISKETVVTKDSKKRIAVYKLEN